jgi:eukaryotic-like serine/threonine-protein kinase
MPPVPPADSWLGTVLAETYRIVRVLGEGGMGSVYEAQHTRLPRSFAIKVLRDDCFRDHTTLTRFQREAEIACRLKHRHIVEVMDYNTTREGLPYIVMEYLEGEDLAGRLARRGRLPLGAALSIVRQVAAALAAAHGQGVVHRDLKPHNIFLCHQADRDDYVKILDFGISKLVGVRSSLTGDRAIMGTPWYMAPEQARATEEVDHRADLFALGAIAFEMLAGKPPFSGDTPLVALHNVVYEPPASLHAANDQVPVGVEEVLQRALAKSPGERYQRVEELAVALLQAARLPLADDEDWVEISTSTSAAQLATSGKRSTGGAVRASVSTAMRQTTLAPTPIGGAALQPLSIARHRRALLLAGVAVMCVGGAVAGLLVARRIWGPGPPTARPIGVRTALGRDAGEVLTPASDLRATLAPAPDAALDAAPETSLDARSVDASRRAAPRRPRPRRDASVPVRAKPDAATPRPAEKRLPKRLPEKRLPEKRPPEKTQPTQPKKDWIIKPKIDD